MTNSWVIAAFYFRRMARKPLLILFLLATPFTLLLAEFAAFGRAVPTTTMKPVPIRVIAKQSALTDSFTLCLARQTGHPLQVTQAANSDSIMLSGSSPIRVTVQGNTTSKANYILEDSIARICALRESDPSLPARPIVLRHSVANSNPAAASGAVFFARFFPGLALFGALFLSQAMASLVWRDYERTAQQRLLTIPVGPSALVFGPLLFLTTGAAAALLLILAVCAFAVNPAALASPALWALAIGFSLCAAGLQLATGLVAKSHRAATAISASTNMMLAFLGGGFVPLVLYPPFLRTIAYALPNGAAQAGISATLQGLANPGDLSWRIATVWLWGAILIFAAIVSQTRRMRI